MTFGIPLQVIASSLNLVAVARILELVGEFIHLPNIFATVTLYSPIGSTAKVYGKCCCTISRAPPRTEIVHDGARTSCVAPRMRRPFRPQRRGCVARCGSGPSGRMRCLTLFQDWT
jgi:hypothetical protein